MAYLPKSIAEKSIRERVRKSQDGTERTDYEVYLGVDVFTGRPVRITRSDLKTLKRDIAKFYARLRHGGDAAVMLSAEEAVDARHALKIIESEKIGKSITEIVREYMSGHGRGADGIVADENMKVEDAFKAYYNGKPEGVNKEFIKNCTGKWVECNIGRRITTLTTDEIKGYLDNRYGHKKPRTYNAHLKYIRIFLNWCANDCRRYILKNPALQIEMKQEPWIEPEYMRPGDVRDLFRLLESHKIARPDMLAYAVTSFFCGARGVEIMRIAQGDGAATINLDDETIRIAKGKGFQHGRRPRAFHIEPTALAWMRSFDYVNAVRQIDSSTMNDISDLAKRHSVPTFRNCGRHSFITYHVAAHGEPEKTQAIVGTSERMRANNYCGLASRADANEYFGILPDPSVAEADPHELKRTNIGSDVKVKRERKPYIFDRGYGEFVRKQNAEIAEKIALANRAAAAEEEEGDKDAGVDVEIC